MRRVGLAVILSCCSLSVALACGTERWTVKIGADRDAGSVTTAPQTASIADLTNLSAPPHPNSRPNTRFAPTELKTFQIHGVMTLAKKEDDEDYHIVITDTEDEELTMIVESVAPGCTEGSLFTEEIENVRKAINQKLGSVSKKKKHPNIPVTVTGIAFFDPIHGQEGVAPNGIELHPVLAIEFH